MGVRVAQSLVSSNFLDFIELTPNYRLVELAAIPAWENKTLKDLNIRVKYGVTVMAIKHGDQVNVSPAGHDIINSGDVLVVIGSVEDIKNFQERSNAKYRR